MNYAIVSVHNSIIYISTIISIIISDAVTFDPAYKLPYFVWEISRSPQDYIRTYNVNLPYIL